MKEMFTHLELNNLMQFFQTSEKLLKLRKCTLSGYRGREELKAVYISPVKIKDEVQAKWVFRYKTKDITKNIRPSELLAAFDEYVSAYSFTQVNLDTSDLHIHIRITKKGKWLWSEKKVSNVDVENQLSHNKDKNRLLSTDVQWLKDLGITDDLGNIKSKSQKKFKQIHQYLHHLKPILDHLLNQKEIIIHDMGSGKGYLTFAIAEYFQDHQKEAQISGIELRDNLVDNCNQVAMQSSFDKLKFYKGTILDHIVEHTNVLIALHACDTATDDAISKGIKANADFIVVAPCCHKQIRSEMNAEKMDKQLSPLIQEGIFLERQAELITDSIRMLLLEKMGYSVKALEFVSTEHTAKNVMIIASKAKEVQKNSFEIDEKIDSLKKKWGINSHYLETII